MKLIKVNFEQLCDWISAERKRQGYTQKDFAKKTKLARSTISNLENHGNPKLSTIIRCCLSLGYCFGVEMGDSHFTLTSIDLMMEAKKEQPSEETNFEFLA